MRLGLADSTLSVRMRGSVARESSSCPIGGVVRHCFLDQVSAVKVENR